MKDKLIKSTIILLLGGFLTKILGLLIKIVMTRFIGIDGLSLYMMVLPMFSLCISLGQIGIPISLSRLVALDKMNNRKLYFSILPIIVLFDSFLSLLIIILASFISINLFHNNDLYLPIVGIGLVIPFTSISSMCRSYFFGKEKMVPHIISNIVEDIVRLLLVYFILPNLISLDMKYIVFFIIIFNIVSELASTLVLFFFLPRKISLEDFDFSFDKRYITDTMRIAIPNISSSLIGNIVYFLEPIILTNILIYVGYSSVYITHEYGIITGYVIPLLLIPSFFTFAISQALLPYISKEYNLEHYSNVRKRINFILFFLLIIGIILCIIFELFGKYLLLFIYDTSFGFNYLKILAPFCILQYSQSLIVSSLNAIGKSKDIFFISLKSSFVRVFSLIILSLFKIGIYSFVFSLIINILFNTFILYNKLSFYLNK